MIDPLSSEQMLRSDNDNDNDNRRLRRLSGGVADISDPYVHPYMSSTHALLPVELRRISSRW